MGVLLMQMRRGRRSTGYVLSCVLLAACADGAASQAVTPNAPVIVQDVDTTRGTSDAQGADGGANVASPPSENSSSASSGSAASNGARDLATTGIASCDAYLTRVEICSRRILPKNSESNAAFHRITSSLDTARRAWRDVAQSSSSSTSLARTCADAMRSYNESISNLCPVSGPSDD